MVVNSVDVDAFFFKTVFNILMIRFTVHRAVVWQFLSCGCDLWAYYIVG